MWSIFYKLLVISLRVLRKKKVYVHARWNVGHLIVFALFQGLCLSTLVYIQVCMGCILNKDNIFITVISYKYIILSICFIAALNRSWMKNLNNLVEGGKKHFLDSSLADSRGRGPTLNSTSPRKPVTVFV